MGDTRRLTCDWTNFMVGIDTGKLLGIIILFFRALLKLIQVHIWCTLCLQRVWWALKASMSAVDPPLLLIRHDLMMLRTEREVPQWNPFASSVKPPCSRSLWEPSHPVQQHTLPSQVVFLPEIILVHSTGKRIQSTLKYALKKKEEKRC